MMKPPRIGCVFISGPMASRISGANPVIDGALTGVQNLSFHPSMFVSDNELRCRLAPRHHLTMYHKAESRGSTSKPQC